MRPPTRHPRPRRPVRPAPSPHTFVAGARVELSLLAITLGLLYATLRTVGAIAASTAAARVAGRRTSGDLAGRLIRPGVFGVAFALNAAGIAGGGDASLLLATIVLGAIGAESRRSLLPLRPMDQ